ncbi:ACP phosphodiesterase [Alloalcanivorax sp.]|jgi:acyl carrier protein phosphodiesterase|nr:ACP phosphodiesterase [Alcanivorax sp.]MCH9782655.1 ACP phosphodiesterase [Gammaproteobacteria bacterium]MED5602982.1 ACP phosphodiesterase [Pseudomonadota bacterium]MEE3010265.1 ACP phosphodiesterase [Pseudomonadota bacterium]HAB08981.1 DUF479 domain-containing protein [Alcanivorax sp.]
MNYFAHLTLARPTVPSKVGNLLGDFMRGVREPDLPEAVRLGLHNHRLVDRFTDHHPLVIESRALFSPQRRRFAGVALDVLFDHFLIRHWSRFHDTPLDQAIDKDYRLLRDGAALMPATMRATTGRIVEHDWFGHYAELENVGRALDRIAARVRFANRFDGAIEDIERHHDRLEAVFLALYPALREHVDEQALEAPPADDGGVTAG